MPACLTDVTEGRRHALQSPVGGGEQRRQCNRGGGERCSFQCCECACGLRMACAARRCFEVVSRAPARAGALALLTNALLHHVPCGAMPPRDALFKLVQRRSGLPRSQLFVEVRATRVQASASEVVSAVVRVRDIRDGARVLAPYPNPCDADRVGCRQPTHNSHTRDSHTRAASGHNITGTQRLGSLVSTRGDASLRCRGAVTAAVPRQQRTRTTATRAR